LAADWGALPYPGALVDQPLRLLLIGSRMRELATAYALTEGDGKPPKWADTLVARVSAMDAQARMRGE
jgi:hypothetical protein